MSEEFKGKKKEPPKPNSYEALITKELLAFVAKVQDKNPDKGNVGTQIGNTFVWDVIVGIAKKMSDAHWEDFERQELIPKKETLEVGNHGLIDSPRFSIVAKVATPAKRFDAATLADLLFKSKYKIPLPVGMQFANDAKKANKSAVTFDIVEKVT